MKSYRTGLTNLASTEEKIEAMNVPAIIICMKPAWKKSVLEKYNTTEAFFQMTDGSYEHLIGEKTMKEIVSEASFKLNQDLNIEIGDFFHPKIDLKVGSNKFQLNEKEHTLNVTDIFSLLNGVCYTISSNLPISNKNGYILSVKLADEMTEKPDQVGLTIVSEEDSLGILYQLWETANVMKEQTVSFETGTTQVTLHETRQE